MHPAQFLLRAVSIIAIDLLLAGDNALVIAVAVRALPKRERRIGTTVGAALAVALRVVLTFFAARLLSIPYLQLAGGVFILWIAFKVMVDASDPPDAAPPATRLWQAVRYVVVADLTMSVDNILAIAAASKGHFWLIAFGLALSIPFVVFSANLLADLMNRYPATIYLGSAILGKVAADMILAELRVTPPAVYYGNEAALVIALVAAGMWISRRRRRQNGL